MGDRLLMELFKKQMQAIKLINPNAHYVIRENNLDKITWDDDTTPISKYDIEAKMIEVQTAYDNNEYKSQLFPFTGILPEIQKGHLWKPR